jgi:hypothetical protein
VTLTALFGVGAIALAQLVQPVRDDPAERSGFDAPRGIQKTLRKACYDCHSNQTAWPWYSAVAPVSWIVSAHVHAGRRHLNFSEWSDYASDPGTVADKFNAIAKQVRERRMPPWYYRVTHPRSRLDAEQRDALIGWAEREGANAAVSVQ